MRFLTKKFDVREYTESLLSFVLIILVLMTFAEVVAKPLFSDQARGQIYCDMQYGIGNSTFVYWDIKTKTVACVNNSVKDYPVKIKTKIYNKNIIIGVG